MKQLRIPIFIIMFLAIGLLHGYTKYSELLRTSITKYMQGNELSDSEKDGLKILVSRIHKQSNPKYDIFSKMINQKKASQVERDLMIQLLKIVKTYSDIGNIYEIAIYEVTTKKNENLLFCYFVFKTKELSARHVFILGNTCLVVPRFTYRAYDLIFENELHTEDGVFLPINFKLRSSTVFNLNNHRGYIFFVPLNKAKFDDGNLLVFENEQGAFNVKFEESSILLEQCSCKEKFTISERKLKLLEKISDYSSQTEVNNLIRISNGHFRLQKNYFTWNKKLKKIADKYAEEKKEAWEKLVKKKKSEKPVEEQEIRVNASFRLRLSKLDREQTRGNIKFIVNSRFKFNGTANIDSTMLIVEKQITKLKAKFGEDVESMDFDVTELHQGMDNLWTVHKISHNDSMKLVVFKNKDIMYELPGSGKMKIELGEFPYLYNNKEYLVILEGEDNFTRILLVDKSSEVGKVQKFEINRKLRKIDHGTFMVEVNSNKESYPFVISDGELVWDLIDTARKCIKDGRMEEAASYFGRINRENPEVKNNIDLRLSILFYQERYKELKQWLNQNGCYGDTSAVSMYIISDAAKHDKYIQPYKLIEYTDNEAKRKKSVNLSYNKWFRNGRFPDFVPENLRYKYSGQGLVTMHTYNDYNYNFFVADGRIILFDGVTDNLIFDKRIDKTVSCAYAKENMVVLCCQDSIYGSDEVYDLDVTYGIYCINLDDYGIDTLLSGLSGFYEGEYGGNYISGMKLIDNDSDGDNDLLLYIGEWGEDLHNRNYAEFYENIENKFVKSTNWDSLFNYRNRNKLDVNNNTNPEYFESINLCDFCKVYMELVRVYERKSDGIDTLYALLGNLKFHSIHDYDNDGIDDVLLESSYMYDEEIQSNGVKYYLLKKSDEDPEAYTKRMIDYYFKETMSKEYLEELEKTQKRMTH